MSELPKGLSRYFFSFTFAPEPVFLPWGQTSESNDNSCADERSAFHVIDTLFQCPRAFVFSEEEHWNDKYK